MTLRRTTAIGIPLFTWSALALSACESDTSVIGSPLPQVDASLPASGDAGPPDSTVRETGAPDAYALSYEGGGWIDAGGGSLVPRVGVLSEFVNTRADVAQLMFAAGEMQTSGEPFASNFAGRNLGNYDRTRLPTDLYLEGIGTPVESALKDLFGFSTAVESYEYSKYHMNMVANQSTAGLSLATGPVVARRVEATTLARLQGRANELLSAAGADVGGIAALPPPTTNVTNRLGFPGLWPSFAPFASFDPTMYPTSNVVAACPIPKNARRLTPEYGGLPGGLTTPLFECDYSTLQLPNRDGQVDKTLVPAVLGFATWKEALWSIDFAGRIHDSSDTQVNAVADSDRALVGTKGNLVTGTDPATAAAGTYLGSTPLEDTWGLMMLDEMDNAADFLVSRMTTTDGAKLSGFPSKAAALAYDYTSPLRWFPAAVAVTETAMTPDTPFPDLATMTVTDGTSRALDLAALLLGNSLFFGETDARNAGIGQRIGLLLTFDGDPFPADNGLPDGEETAHDRSLSVLRVAFVDLDRIHSIPVGSGGVVTADTAAVANGAPLAGNTVTTTSLAHTVQALHQTLLSLNGAISQYGAADPDPAADLLGILNTPVIHPTAPGAATTMSARVRQLFLNDIAFFMNTLTSPAGQVVNGATVAAGIPTAASDATRLESQAAAVRALVDAFLVTNDPQYLVRGRAVAKVLLTAFFNEAGQMFGATPTATNDIVMTPEIFAFLQSALRETHEVLHDETDPLLQRGFLEHRVARVNKLFLNGWDDLDGDETVLLTTECLGARLQQGEQMLTGELGSANKLITTDRDSDCVKEINSTQMGSVLASQVHFHSP